MAYVVINIGTQSTVDHTESYKDSPGAKPVAMVWEVRIEAARHAYNLTQEYALTMPHLRPPYRTWRTKEATPEQVGLAKQFAAFGRDYVDVIGTGQARPDARGVQRAQDEIEEKVERFRRELDEQ